MRRNVYLLKIEAKSFSDARQDIVRIQKVIWDHLLAFKGEIIKKQALFSLLFRSLFYLAEVNFFRLNHVRKAWN